MRRSQREPAAALILALAAALVVAVAVVDYATGLEYRVFPLYFVPVTLVSLRLGRGAGLVFAALSAAGWLLSNQLAGMDVARAPVVAVVNTGVMLLTFLVVALLTAAQRTWLQRERALSRTDSLTGVANGRGFYEAAGSEIARAARYRHPLTLAYIDLDDFKAVNDRFGHARGDTRSRGRPGDVPGEGRGKERRSLRRRHGGQGGRACGGGASDGESPGLRKILVPAPPGVAGRVP